LRPRSLGDMGEDHSHAALGDMIAGLVEELDQRVSLDPDTRQIVLIAVAPAANNGRVIGADEMIAQAIEMGIDLSVRLVPGDQAPATLAEALGDN
jgi:hypothetical protein